MDTVQARALRRAVEILGGIEEAEQYLGLPSALLTLWLSEKARTPESVFLRVVDLITEHDIAALGKTNAIAEHAAIETDVQSVGSDHGTAP